MGVFRVLGGSCSAFFRPNPPAHSPTRAQGWARRAASGEGSSPSEASLRGVGQLRNLGGCRIRQVPWEEAAAGAVKGPFSVRVPYVYSYFKQWPPESARGAHVTAAPFVPCVSPHTPSAKTPSLCTQQRNIAQSSSVSSATQDTHTHTTPLDPSPLPPPASLWRQPVVVCVCVHTARPKKNRAPAHTRV